MKPLTLEETKLKEEMKERCLAKGQYIDENAKAKFNMLCHLEDFEVRYWELEQRIKKAIKFIRNHQLVFKDATLEEIEEWFNQFYIDVLDILKGVSNNE